MNAGAVEKLLRKIEDVKEAFARRKYAAAKEAFEEVRKAEQMFLDALVEKGMRFEKERIIGANEDDDEVKKSNKKQSGEKMFVIRLTTRVGRRIIETTTPETERNMIHGAGQENTKSSTLQKWTISIQNWQVPNSGMFLLEIKEAN